MRSIPPIIRGCGLFWGANRRFFFLLVLFFLLQEKKKEKNVSRRNVGFKYK